MKVLCIHGQNHQGNTYKITQMLLEELGAGCKEIFLPRDFNKMCIGCYQCFLNSEKNCPHYQEVNPIVELIEEADLIILTSPVYCFHGSAGMKAFLEHLGYRWMVHRPSESMFRKQGLAISSTLGAGLKSTLKMMTDSLFFWGCARVYKLGFALHEMKLDKMTDKKKIKLQQRVKKLAHQIKRDHDNLTVSLKTKVTFNVMSKMMKKNANQADHNYWQEQGWLDQKKPWAINKD